MNASEAINKIAELLGMKFKSEKFFQTKLVDGTTTITNSIEAPFTVGDVLYVVGEDNIMTPAPAGRHETREGIILVVKEDGGITAIEEKPETEESSTVDNAEVDIETQTEVMTEATLTDGTKIMTDDSGDFKVGEKLYVITESGEKVSAPEGEHTTESGIVLTVDGEGFITGVKYPDEEGEGSLEDYKKDMEKMKEMMSEMFTLVSSIHHDFESYKKDYEEFKKQPNFKEPVVRKTFGKENLMDAKYAFLKNNIL